jgi:hypothetical protein
MLRAVFIDSSMQGHQRFTCGTTRLLVDFWPLVCCRYMQQKWIGPFARYQEPSPLPAVLLASRRIRENIRKPVPVIQRKGKMRINCSRILYCRSIVSTRIRSARTNRGTESPR